jgi:hypothetical protein
MFPINNFYLIDINTFRLLLDGKITLIREK